MTSTATPADVSAKVRTRGRRARPRRRISFVKGGVAILVLLVVVAVVWLFWLVTGLADSSRTVQAKAAVAQNELELFRDSLQAGDEVAAKAHLRAGRAALAQANHAAQADQVRTAKGLPFVGPTVNDLDHLLAAAGILTRSAGDALSVYENFSGDDSELFHNGKFSIPAIKQAQVSVDAIKVSLVAAKVELGKVTGDGYKGDEALAKKRSALRQVASLQQEIVSLGPLLDNMPSAVGADGKKTYLVAIMNPAEMRASGGAPLSVAFLRFKDGKMSVPLKGSTSGLTQTNKAFYWNRLAGKKDPFQPPAGYPQRFVNTNVNPSFVTSGEQMVRATQANFFGFKTDGVIALDITAIGHLLDATGPIKTDFYGTLTGENIAHKLVVKAYKTGSDDASVNVRHDVNDQLMAVMLTRLTEGGGLITKARALGEAIPGRHLQLYFKDPALQKVVVDKGMGGAIPVRDTGNLTAVYTQNGNASKMDVFQQRTVRETVRLRTDGSAVVRRTVQLTNDSPPFVGPGGIDLHSGYDTRWATELVINLMPPGSRVTKQPTVELPRTVADGVDQDGHTYAKAAIVLPPGAKGSLTWEYVVPHAAVVKGSRMYLRDYVAPQAVLNVPTLELRVIAPDGWTAPIGSGWEASAHGVRTTVPMDRLKVLKLTLRRSTAS